MAANSRLIEILEKGGDGVLTDSRQWQVIMAHAHITQHTHIYVLSLNHSCVCEFVCGDVKKTNHIIHKKKTT